MGSLDCVIGYLKDFLNDKILIIQEYIPYHEFFLSLFCGACWVELNKPRSRYECYNDLDSEIINYLVMIERYPKEFDEMKQGVYGLVSQEICNRIVRGELKPRNDLERAYFFYFLNKLTFGGDVKKIGNNENAHAHQGGIMRPTDPIRKPQYEKIKNEWETKGYVGIESGRSGGTFNKQRVEKIKKEFKTKGYHGLVDQKLQNARIDKPGVEEAKSTYRGIVLPTVCKDKSVNDAKANYGGILGGVHPLKNVSKKGAVEKAKKRYKETTFPLFSSGIGGGDGAGNNDNIKKAKSRFKGMQPNGMQVRETNVKSAKASFAGINNTRAGNNASNMRDMDKWKKEFKDTVNEKKSSFKGIANHGATGWGTLESGEVKKAKQQYQAVSYKGINPKTTRPYHNNDCGLLTPLDKKAIERLRYVNLTCYDFKRVYTLFYKAFHERKGLSRECFVYADPPYVGTEKYYGNLFPTENHQALIDFMLKTPFNFMLSIGGKCEMYLEQLSDWVIVPVKVRYSTDATSQKKSQEYIVMNYEVNDIGNMQIDNQYSLKRFMK